MGDMGLKGVSVIRKRVFFSPKIGPLLSMDCLVLQFSIIHLMRSVLQYKPHEQDLRCLWN